MRGRSTREPGPRNKIRGNNVFGPAAAGEPDQRRIRKIKVTISLQCKLTVTLVGGAVFVPMAMTPYGGWHREDKDLAESWTRRTTHTGDNVGYYDCLLYTSPSPRDS